MPSKGLVPHKSYAGGAGSVKPYKTAGLSEDEVDDIIVEAGQAFITIEQVGWDLTNEILTQLKENPIPFVNIVLGLVNTVISLIAQAQANKAQLKMISERLTVVIPFLNKLKTLECQQNVILAINEFAAVVKDCQTQAAVYADASWFKRVISSGTDKKKFEDLLQRLNHTIAHLDLGLAVEQTQMLEILLEREAADNQAIRNNLQEILLLQELSLKEIQASRKEIQSGREEQEEFFLDQQEQNFIMGLQLQSVSTGLSSQLELTEQERQKFLEREFATLNKKFTEVDLRPPVRKPPISSHLSVSFHEITFLAVLNKGSFGTVYLGEWRGVKVAVKKVVKRLTKAQYEQFIREMKIMARLRNPHITQLYGACLEPEACIVMEYAANRSLDHYVATNSLSLVKKVTIAQGIAKGLFHVHESEVLHRDLNPGNVLIDEHGVPKLTDFGLAKTLDKGIGTINDRTEAIAWLAPEALGKRSIHTSQSEIYSFGLILWFLLTEKLPFAEIPEAKLAEQKRAGCQLKMPKDMAEELTTIVTHCLEQDPGKRPLLPVVIEQLHTYLKSLQLTPEKMFEQGMEAEKQGDFTTARRFYHSSAKCGFFKGKTNLASLLLEGKGGSPNPRQAYQLLLDAANAGHPRAMTNLGDMLLQGYGVPQDLVEARKWLTLAVQKGSKEAESLLNAAKTGPK